MTVLLIMNVKTAKSGIKKVCHHIIPHLQKARLYLRKKTSALKTNTAAKSLHANIRYNVSI